jgi:hypothetical protein
VNSVGQLYSIILREKDVQLVKEKDFGWINKVSTVLPILEDGTQNVWQRWGLERANGNRSLDDMLMKLDMLLTDIMKVLIGVRPGEMLIAPDILMHIANK